MFSIENEEHMLLLCPVYNDLRETLFTTLVHEFPDINGRTDRERLCTIFDCKQNRSIRTCAKTCFDILKLRPRRQDVLLLISFENYVYETGQP